MSRSVKHYIFGYGSLINSASRKVTGDTGIAVPVKVAGYTRHWAKITEGFGMSSVVVIPNSANNRSQCNGVLVEVNESEFPCFDEREHGYVRMLVDPLVLSFYRSTDANIFRNDTHDVNVWVYQTQEVTNPCNDFPVVFSYLDVILAGCLEYSIEFCDDFLEMTQGWQHSMLNDRLTPRYPRVQEDLETVVLNKYIAKTSMLDESEIAQSYA